ncbi:hypothetical protein [uncultured Methanobrevibacter sp.]|uniref:hypothetical protein n=1 Tax=uncultured Methanobrevibacter sp. TaxID=253161 RepID=UPI0025F7AD20|nr:hypothetical protein [uncultured Methanobrevibacter sp.]
MGVISNYTTNYVLSTNLLVKTVSNEHTLLKCNTNYGHCFIINSNKNFSHPLKIEFDIDSISSNHYFNIFDEDAEVRVTLPTIGHYIIIIPSNGIITATCNGNNVSVNSNNPVTNLARLSFFVVNNGDYLTFKNVIIYSI